MREAATGKTIAELDVDGPDAVAAAVAAGARRTAGVGGPGREGESAAAQAGAARDGGDRGAILDLLDRETGKPHFDIVGEMMGVCLDIGYLAGAPPALLKPRRVGTRPLFGKRGRSSTSRAASSGSSARGTRRSIWR